MRGAPKKKKKEKKMVSQKIVCARACVLQVL